jgi:hypothetical protein
MSSASLAVGETSEAREHGAVARAGHQVVGASGAASATLTGVLDRKQGCDQPGRGGAGGTEQGPGEPGRREAQSTDSGTGESPSYGT